MDFPVVLVPLFFLFVLCSGNRGTHEGQCFHCPGHTDLILCLREHHNHWNCDHGQFCDFHSSNIAERLCKPMLQLPECEYRQHHNHHQCHIGHIHLDCSYCCPTAQCLLNYNTPQTAVITTLHPPNAPQGTSVQPSGGSSCFTVPCDQPTTDNIHNCMQGGWACSDTEVCMIALRTQGQISMVCRDDTYLQTCQVMEQNNPSTCSVAQFQRVCNNCCKDEACFHQVVGSWVQTPALSTTGPATPSQTTASVSAASQTSSVPGATQSVTSLGSAQSVTPSGATQSVTSSGATQSVSGATQSMTPLGSTQTMTSSGATQSVSGATQPITSLGSTQSMASSGATQYVSGATQPMTSPGATHSVTSGATPSVTSSGSTQAMMSSPMVSSASSTQGVTSGVTVGQSTASTSDPCYHGCSQWSDIASCTAGSWLCGPQQFCQLMVHSDGSVSTRCQDNTRLQACNTYILNENVGACQYPSMLPAHHDCLFCCQDDQSLQKALGTSYPPPTQLPSTASPAGATSTMDATGSHGNPTQTVATQVSSGTHGNPTQSATTQVGSGTHGNPSQSVTTQAATGTHGNPTQANTTPVSGTITPSQSGTHPPGTLSTSSSGVSSNTQSATGSQTFSNTIGSNGITTQAVSSGNVSQAPTVSHGSHTFSNTVTSTVASNGVTTQAVSSGSLVSQSSTVSHGSHTSSNSVTSTAGSNTVTTQAGSSGDPGMTQSVTGSHGNTSVPVYSQTASVTPSTTVSTTATPTGPCVDLYKGDCMADFGNMCAIENVRKMCPKTCGVCEATQCVQCGDVDRGVPCTGMELLEDKVTPCDDPTHTLCMTDITVDLQGQMSLYKRCVDERTCREKWYVETSDNHVCLALTPASHTTDITCHYCCTHSACNVNTVPVKQSFWLP